MPEKLHHQIRRAKALAEACTKLAKPHDDWPLTLSVAKAALDIMLTGRDYDRAVALAGLSEPSRETRVIATALLVQQVETLEAVSQVGTAP